MAAPDVTKVQGATGTLIWNPTSLALGVLVGGTTLGIVADIRLIPVQRSFINRAEEYGSKAVQEYDMGRDWICSGEVRGNTSDVLDVIFPVEAGGVVTEALAQSGGKRLSLRSAVLLFKPRDPLHDGFILRRALPRVAESARMPFSVHERTSFAVIFRGIPDAGGADIAFGPYASLAI